MYALLKAPCRSAIEADMAVMVTLRMEALCLFCTGFLLTCWVLSLTSLPRMLEDGWSVLLASPANS